MRRHRSTAARTLARALILAPILSAACALLLSSARADDILSQGGVSAQPPKDPSEPCSCSATIPTAGEPVYVDTGEFAINPGEDLTTPDPVIPVRGHTIDLRRSYRSGYAYNGVLGYGWDFAANRRLRQLNNGNVLITSGTCRSDEYIASGSSWTAPPGIFRTLVLNGNGSYTEAFPSGLQDTFDEHGNLIERRDRHGNRIAFEYSEDLMPIMGRAQFFVDTTPRVVALEYRLLRIIDPTNRQINFTYNAQGRISAITDWIGRTWSYAYDAFGNLASVTSPPIAQYPQGTSTTYFYANATFPHKITRVVPPNGQATNSARVENTYDTLGRVQRQDVGGGGTYLYTYQTNQTVVTDPSGTTWKYTSENRQITSETVVTRGVRPPSVEPVGTQYTTSYVYTNEQRTRTVYPEGNALELVYDTANSNVLARGNLLEARRLPKPGSSAPPIVTHFTYKTPFQQIGSITDPLGAVTEFFYDSNNNLMRIQYPTVPEGTPNELYTINIVGEVTSFTDANGNQTALVYDANGYLDQITRAFGTSLAATTEFDPDAVGRRTVMRDANGHATHLTHNAWDLLEQKVAPAPFLYTTDLAYDASGNLAQVDEQSEIPNNPQTTTFTYNVRDWLLSITNEMSQTTAYGYDGRGNRITTTDPELNVVSRVFDERNKLYTETAANGDQVTLNYHSNGSMAAVIDGNGHQTMYDYDAFDRQNLITHEGGSTAGRTYDVASNVIGATTRSGASFTYVYDAHYHLRSRMTPEEVATFAYDLGGRMTAAVNPAATLTYAYNARSQLITETTTLAGLSPLIVTHEYDGAGNRTRVAYPDSSIVTYDYDAQNRLERVQDPDTQDLSEWVYDELGRVKTRILPSGITTKRTYDRVGRITDIELAQSNGMLDKLSYGRDATGRTTTVQSSLGVSSYGYDAKKQLITATYPSAAPFLSTTFFYDTAGNRVLETTNSPTTYTSNNLNQYTSVGGVPRSYDANGNLIGEGVNQYVFDAENRLQAILGSQASSYGYDPFMRRTQKTVSGVTTHFLWSGGRLLEEYDAEGARSTRYIYGDDRFVPIHVRTKNSSGNEVVYSIEGDQLGSPRNVIDPSGHIVWRIEYDAFGNGIVDAGSDLVFNLRLPGQYYDEESTLHYNRYRYYSPQTGRYLSPDGIGQRRWISLYSYVGADPLSFIDPLGLDIFVEGASGNENGLHQSLGIGDPLGQYVTVSDGLISAWPNGAPYVDSEKGGPIRRYIHTTPQQDVIALEEMEKALTTRSYYPFTTCVTWSNAQFDNFRDRFGVPESTPPPREPAPRDPLRVAAEEIAIALVGGAMVSQQLLQP